MIKAIRSEQLHLRNIAIFFVCMDKESLPLWNFFDDWIANVWGKKLGIHVNFCRMIQKGLFVIFLKSHNMQDRVLKKDFWNVGCSLFREFPWSPKGNVEQVIARSSPNWVEIKNLQPEFWPFIPQIQNPLGSVLQVEESRTTLPHLNARLLLHLIPRLCFLTLSLFILKEKALLGNCPCWAIWGPISSVKLMGI